MLIKIQPEDLFKEVKSLILNEFDNTTNEIENYLEQNKNEKSKKLLTRISANILFIISDLTYKLDYYNLTINCIVEKLNRFFIDFVEITKNSIHFPKILDLIQKFVKIKKTFMKDFIEIREKNKEGEFEDYDFDNKIIYNFALNKFCSFGRYFFNNLPDLVDINISNNSNFKNQALYTNRINNTFKNNYKNVLSKCNFIRRNEIDTGNHLMDGKNKLYLDKYFKFYFKSKLVLWKYSFIQPGTKKIEICRICEKTFEINEFVLHLYFCKEQKLNHHNLLEIKYSLKKPLDNLKNYRE